MRNKNNKHLGIEIEPELHHKLHYIAKYEGRSGNGQILHLIRRGVLYLQTQESVREGRRPPLLLSTCYYASKSASATRTTRFTPYS